MLPAQERPGWWARWRQRFSARLQDNRALYVIQVILLSFTAVLLSQFSMSYGPARLMSLGLCLVLLLLLLAFVRGLLSLNKVVFFGASMGAVYVCLCALVEGGVLSSTLVWLPLLALAIFYVVGPRTGRAWMVAMMLLTLGVAAISWRWGRALPLPGLTELSALSLADYLITTLGFLLVPYFGACIHSPPPPASRGQADPGAACAPGRPQDPLRRDGPGRPGARPLHCLGQP